MDAKDRAIKLVMDSGKYEYKHLQSVWRIPAPQMSQGYRDVPIDCLFTDIKFWEVLGELLGLSDPLINTMATSWFCTVMDDNDEDGFWEEWMK